MQLKFWGVRGSIPSSAAGPDINLTLKTLIESVQNCPGIPNKAEELPAKLPRHLICPVGGNTPCIEVKHENTRIILDMGSGLRLLGAKLSLDVNLSKIKPSQQMSINLATEGPAI